MWEARRGLVALGDADDALAALGDAVGAEVPLGVSDKLCRADRVPDAAREANWAEAAARKLRRINSEVAIEPIVVDVDRTNILELAGDADLILDGSDNFEVRYIINDAAVKLNKPWVYGGCIGSYGQSMTIVQRRL